MIFKASQIFSFAFYLVHATFYHIKSGSTEEDRRSNGSSTLSNLQLIVGEVTLELTHRDASEFLFYNSFVFRNGKSSSYYSRIK